MAGSLREEPRDGVPHDRELSITWSDGARWQVRLDQGFGFLRPETWSQNYDFDRTPRGQAVNLVRDDFRVESWPNAATPSYVFAVEKKKRS